MNNFVKVKKIIKIIFSILLFLLCSKNYTICAQDFNWSVALQGVGDDLGTDIVTDSNGNIYAVGLFENVVDFDPSEDVYYLNELNANKGNTYCIKLSPSGELIWAHQVGGTLSLNTIVPNLDQPKLAIDGSNNIYITGLYNSIVDFDTSETNTFFIPNSSTNIAEFRFLCKLDSNGNLIWAKQIFGNNGSSIDVVNIEVESNGNIYISGNFNNTFDFDPGQNTYNLSTNNSYDDIFCLKLDPNGNFIWAKQMGNPTENDRVKDMNIDDEYLYITGSYRGQADFDPSENVSNLTSVNGSEDAFIAKYDLMNGDLVWANSLGEDNGFDIGYGIVPDNDGNIFATGSFRGTIDFDPSPTTTFTMSSIGSASIYLLKLNEDGEFIWVKNFGAVNGNNGSGERPRNLAIDSSNSVYLSGDFIHQMDCNPDDNDEFYVVNIEGNEDIFILKLDSDGNFAWARSFGSPEKEFPYSIITDINDDIFLTGTFSGLLDFNPNESGGEVDNPWAYDSFILKLSDGTLLGLEEQNSIKSLDILPNPASKYIKVISDLENLEIDIYNINGKLISKHLIKDSSETILVKHLEPGMYFINIISGSEKVVKKLIKI